MFTENTLIACDRDITVKYKWGNFLAVDIKKGEPFYPRRVDYHPNNKGRCVYVPSFAGEPHGFPEEWFYEYDADYVAMHKDIFSQYYKHKRVERSL